MAISWASEEFEAVDLGDKRLNKRLKMLAETLGDKPGASIPAACEGWAETAAAYPSHCTQVMLPSGSGRGEGRQQRRQSRAYLCLYARGSHRAGDVRNGPTKS
jgi:hypothetical protein